MGRGGFPGGNFGGINMNQLMKQAKKMQADIEESQKEIKYLIMTATKKKKKKVDEATASEMGKYNIPGMGF